MAEYNKVYVSLKPELPKVIQQEQIYVYAPRSARAGMKSITGFNITAPVDSVQYDTTNGITVTGNSSLVSEEVSGETSTQNFQSEFKIPIRPGKYISIDATADNKAIKVKVDDTQLALDYYKIKKSDTTNVPAYSPTSGVIALPYSYQNTGFSLIHRGAEGEAKFTYGIFGRWNDIDSGNVMYFSDMYAQLGGSGALSISSSTSDTGTLSVAQLETLKSQPQRMIRYKGQLYYRMDPDDSPDGTMSFVHIDSVQKGTGGYTATGKCFSITVSTRKWKVFDLEFGGSGTGSGLEQIYKWTNGTVSNVTYDTTDGAKVIQTTTVDYTDSTDGSTKQQQFGTTTTLPIVPGKYISMDANSENDALEVKVDDTALALDYIKLDKTKTSAIPQNNSGVLSWLPTSISPTAYSILQRDGDGNGKFNAMYTNLLVGKDFPYQQANMNEVYRACRIAGTDQVIEKTPTDTDTFSADLLAVFQGTPNSHIIYDNQLYYRMDPTDAPDGTLNFIHIDSVQNDEGTYKATGKCFSITVSTRAWQVVDLDFGGSSRTTHNLTLYNSETGTSIYFSLTNNRTETYEGAPAGLWSALENSPIACTVDNSGTYAAGMITIDGDNFKVMYGNSEELIMIQTQVFITDSLV